MEDDDTFDGLNALSTKNVLKLARMQQEEVVKVVIAGI